MYTFGAKFKEHYFNISSLRIQPPFLPSRYYMRDAKKDVCDSWPDIPYWWLKSVLNPDRSADWLTKQFCIISSTISQFNFLKALYIVLSAARRFSSIYRPDQHGLGKSLIFQMALLVHMYKHENVSAIHQFAFSALYAWTSEETIYFWI